MATVAEVITVLRAYEKTVGGSSRANIKDIRHKIERYSLGTPLVAGGSLNLNAGYASTWAVAVRTVSLSGGQVTVSS